MVFNTTFINISTISCWSVLLVEETGVPDENHRPAASHWQTYRVHLAWAGFELTLVVIGNECIASYKFNYHVIMTKTALCRLVILGIKLVWLYWLLVFNATFNNISII